MQGQQWAVVHIMTGRKGRRTADMVAWVKEQAGKKKLWSLPWGAPVYQTLADKTDK